MDPDGYDRARPPYPNELVDRIVAGRTGLTVLDVGCGTGIAAGQFQAAGCSVLGIDPDPRMAEFAHRRGLDVEVADFETWEAAGRSFDVVTAAQSWHWVDPAVGVDKAAGVLRPGGRLAIFSHVFDPPANIADAFAAAFARAVPDAPFRVQSTRSLPMYQAAYAEIADELGEFFENVAQWRFDWTRRYTRKEWLDLLSTTGGLTRLPAGKKAEILDAVGAAIDTDGGVFTMEYTTLATTGVRPG